MTQFFHWLDKRKAIMVRAQNTDLVIRFFLKVFVKAAVYGSFSDHFLYKIFKCRTRFANTWCHNNNIIFFGLKRCMNYLSGIFFCFKIWWQLNYWRYRFLVLMIMVIFDIGPFRQGQPTFVPMSFTRCIKTFKIIIRGISNGIASHAFASRTF